jgi:hypothetical protein
MRTELYWIEGPWPGQLAMSSRPRGGDWLEDEVRAWRQADIAVIVSLLTNDEISELDLTQEVELCKANGLQFIAFPIVDRGVPSLRSAALDFVRKLDTLWPRKKVCLFTAGKGLAGRH